MDFAGPNPHTRLIQVLIEIQIEVLSSIEVLIGGKDFLVFRGSHAASMQIGPALSFPRKWGCQEALESQSRRRRARYKLSCLWGRCSIFIRLERYFDGQLWILPRKYSPVLPTNRQGFSGRWSLSRGVKRKATALLSPDQNAHEPTPNELKEGQTAQTIKSILTTSILLPCKTFFTSCTRATSIFITKKVRPSSPSSIAMVILMIEFESDMNDIDRGTSSLPKYYRLQSLDCE